MTPDEAVILVKTNIKKGSSGQEIILDPIERGINKLHWIKEPSDKSHKILGLKTIKNDKGDECTKIWVKTLTK